MEDKVLILHLEQLCLQFIKPLPMLKKLSGTTKDMSTAGLIIQQEQALEKSLAEIEAR